MSKTGVYVRGRRNYDQAGGGDNIRAVDLDQVGEEHIPRGHPVAQLVLNELSTYQATVQHWLRATPPRSHPQITQPPY